jgi:type IV secretory pathway VirB10-like protein
MTSYKGRPVQPKCDHCGKALYKRMDSGPVKTADPYAWCRNRECEQYNRDQSKGKSPHKALGGVSKVTVPAKRAPDPSPPKAPAMPPAKKAAPPKPAKDAPDRDAMVADAARKAHREAAAAATETSAEDAVSEAVEAAREAAAAATPAAGEHEATVKARARIKKAIMTVQQTYSRNVIGLALAIVAQETGSHEAANALIREYKLDTAYGIQPR